MTLEKNDFTKSHLAPPNLAQIIIWNLENLEFPSFSWFLCHTRTDFRDSESIKGQISEPLNLYKDGFSVYFRVLMSFKVEQVHTS